MPQAQRPCPSHESQAGTGFVRSTENLGLLLMRVFMGFVSKQARSEVGTFLNIAPKSEQKHRVNLTP